MVWYLGTDPVDAAYLGGNPVSGVVASKILDGPDATWSWWVYPQAENFGGYTRQGAVTNDGHQIVVEINNTTLATTSFTASTVTYEDDDHNGPAVLTLSNGHLLVGYTGHSQDHILRWRISITGMIADLGDEQNLAMANVNRKTTYVQLVESPTTPGTVYWFTRLAANSWYACISTDYGQTFGTEHEVVSAGRQYYAIFRPLLGRQLIRAFFYPHPRFAQNTLRVLDIDLSAMATGLVITDGLGQGYLGGAAHHGATLPILEAELSEVYTPAAADESIRLLAANNRGDMVAIAKFKTEANPNAPLGIDPAGTFMVGRLTGSNPHSSASWTWTTLVSNVYPFEVPRRYFGGMEFETVPHEGDALYLAYMTGSTSGPSVLERWASTDGGATWRGTPITKTSNPTRLIRPVAPVGAAPRLALLWAQGSWTTYALFDTDMKAAAKASRAAPTLSSIRWSIRASDAVVESETAKFLIEWHGVSIPSGTTCTIDITESSTAAGADFSTTLDAAITAALTAGVTYDAANNRLSITSAAASPFVVSRTTVAGDIVEDVETWILTISNPSHGSLQEPVSSTYIIDTATIPLYGLSPVSALGFDRLVFDYAGPTIRLRRTSDDAEADFTPNRITGRIDRTAINAWIVAAGAGTAFLRRFYDQAGNLISAFQVTNSLQPAYTDNATPNGRPAATTTGSTQKLQTSLNTLQDNVFAGGGYFMCAFRFTGAGGGGFGRMVDKRSTEGWYLRYVTATNIRFNRAFTTGNRQWDSTVGSGAWLVYGCKFDEGALANVPTVRVNSTTAGASFAVPTGLPAFTETNNVLHLMNTSDGTRGAAGDLFMFALFATPPSDAAQELAEDLVMLQCGIT